MQHAIQLTLWPDQDQVAVTCPRCAQTFDALPALRRHQAAHERAVLEHPQVKALRERTAAFLELALPLLQTGQPVGVTQLADETDYSLPGAYRHIRHLLDRGVLAAEPKTPGGTYHHYRLVFLNGQS